MGPSTTNIHQQWVELVQKRAKVCIFRTFDLFGATRFCCGKCGIPFSRGERVRHFELLFLALGGGPEI